ncbi:MAG: alpha/beta hydrolase, partial [Planctomycetaceae bacterium]|nr:alpha/beta hydrolase [Planctomycetaceae bacterium]
MYFPSEVESHNYTTLKLLSGDAKLNIVVLNPGKKSAILYFGGNAESTIRNAVNFIQIFPEHTIYLHNYRGYGGSSGKPTEDNLYQDSDLV